MNRSGGGQARVGATGATVMDKGIPVREAKRAEILAKFREDHPDLAEAMQLAGEAEALVEAFQQSREPFVTYTTESGTALSR
jgi:hypothetical protein